MNEYIKKTDLLGKIWMWTGAVVVLMVPVIVCLMFESWPPIVDVLKGLLGVAPVYWTVGVIEIITYTPMLGVGGTYLSFVTGNLTALKAPVALNALEANNADINSDEGEVLSTIAIATSSIVTTLILMLGVVGLSILEPVLNNPVLEPAFSNILPALFGGLGVVYISKNPKLSIAPLVLMVLLFLLFPGLGSSVGILVPVGILVTMGVGRILYKKGMI